MGASSWRPDRWLLCSRDGVMALGRPSMHRFDLGGRVAIVTGGNRGIGSGIARGLLECGATLVITGRDAQRNEAMVVELAVFGRPVSAIAMDVSDPEQC